MSDYAFGLYVYGVALLDYARGGANPAYEDDSFSISCAVLMSSGAMVLVM